MGEAATELQSVAKHETESIYNNIMNRRTHELIFGFCGALGSGVSSVASVLSSCFEKTNYEVKIIKMSALITQYIGDKPSFTSAGERIEYLQDSGNQLRKQYGNDFLAQLAVEELKTQRMNEYHLRPNDPLPVEKRVLWIIDSLKNPAEVDLFRAVYGSMFYLIGVLCLEDERVDRLMRNKKITKDVSYHLIERDKSDDFDYGQQLIKTLHKSDFFINNSEYNSQKLSSTINRFISLLFRYNISPTIDEYAMHVAWSSALRSACLSRQVGAVIVSDSGEIIATGRNDVPCFHGGLYSPIHEKEDRRCYNTYDHMCYNDKHKNDLFTQLNGILEQNHISQEVRINIQEQIRKQTRIKDLIEFSRAVHAEMDAIVSASRNVAWSTINATMYVTTFPCHNCAKHIVAAGIKRVYYIEPYEKSLAFELHYDSISLSKAENKVEFLPFEGVAPKQYNNIFLQKNERKQNGIAIQPNIDHETPISDKFIDSYVDYEVKVIDSLNKIKKDGKISKKEDD